MVKTTEYVKKPGCTMFFPKIIVTEEEMKRLYDNRQIPMSWIKLVVQNYLDFENLFKEKRPSVVKRVKYEAMVNQWSYFPDIIIDDIKAFANGEYDLIDFVVKYGIGYKQCRSFFKDVLFQAGCELDVDFYWKQHKKHAQRNTTISLYGVEHTAMLSEVQAKRIATNREKYGADNPMQTNEIKEKLRCRIRKEHGVDYTFQKRSQIPAWQKKIFNCLMADSSWANILTKMCKNADIPVSFELFGSILPVSRRDFIISELENTHVEDLIRLWNNEMGSIMNFPENALFQLPFSFNRTWLKYYFDMGILNVPKHYRENRVSAKENHMEHFLDTLGVSYIHNHKKALKGLELDFYIPDKQLAIEINPNVSHNSNIFALEKTRSMFASRKEPSYHYHKYSKAKDAGITLIQLFANDLEPVTFERITSKRLKSLLCGYDESFYARNIDVVELISETDRKAARNFMNMYHTQGSSRANSYWVFKTGTRWLGVASFTTHKEKGCVELKRLCFMPGIQIVGGLSKLIAHYFAAYTDCLGIYSYSDNSLGNGNGYKMAGATFIKETGPALKFISPKNGCDTYSWQIATSWGAEQGVIGTDADAKGIAKPVTQNEINAYVETELSHRLDDCKGYDRIYTPGSKLWKFNKKG